MILLSRLRAWFRSVTRRSRFERDMAAELRFHLDSYTDDLVRSGVPRGEARRRARLEFGSVEWKKDDCRAALGVRLVDELLGDIRYAVRTLRRAPAFTIVAVATLALAIGANTAMFTLIDAALLRTAPVHEPGRLFELRRLGVGETDRTNWGFTYPLYASVRAHQDAFTSIAAWGPTSFNLAHGGIVKRADGLWVTGSYFGTLEIAPAAGRLIAPADDYRGCPAIAVLSYEFWQRQFGGSPNAIGSTIRLESRPFEIVGITQRGFSGLDLGAKFDVAAPTCATAIMDGIRSRLDARAWWWLTIVGRAAPGVTIEQINARLAAVSAAVTAETVADTWRDDTRKTFLKTRLGATAAVRGIDEYVRSTYQRPLAVLMAVVCLVLLIACANVAGLMLARAAAETRETAVRLSLGAGRGRLVRQVLTHALMLSAAGAAAGVLLAQWATSVLVVMISSKREPLFLDVSSDWRVMGFAAGATVLTALLFGVLPALRATHVSVAGGLRGSGGNRQERSGAVRKWIVGAQIALSLVLLVTAGLLLRSFTRLASSDKGFDKSNVLLVSMNLKSTTIPLAAQLPTFDAIQARLASFPGVTAIGRSHLIPLSGGYWNDYVRTDVQPPASTHDRDDTSLMNFVSPGYFAAMRMRLVAGRDFVMTDDRSGPVVAIVNEAFAKTFFRGASPLGHVLHVGDYKDKPIAIVGELADSKYGTLREDMQPIVFFPIAQIPQPESEDTFAIRSALRADALTPAIEAAVAEVNREVPLEITTAERVVEDAMVRERVLATLSGFFGAMALLLAMVGLYGTISYRVTLRRAEFGIRKALGAPSGAITTLVIAEVGAILLAGTAAGLTLSALTTSVLGKLLFDIQPRDATTMAAAAILLAVVVLAAGYLPARRAARVDPMTALRCD